MAATIGVDAGDKNHLTRSKFCFLRWHAEEGLGSAARSPWERRYVKADREICRTSLFILLRLAGVSCTAHCSTHGATCTERERSSAQCSRSGSGYLSRSCFLLILIIRPLWTYRPSCPTLQYPAPIRLRTGRSTSRPMTQNHHQSNAARYNEASPLLGHHPSLSLLKGNSCSIRTAKLEARSQH